MNIYFGKFLRFSVAFIIGVITFFSALTTFPNEAAFWALIVTIATTAFLLVKPNMSFKDRIRRVSLWDLMAPVVLIVFATVQHPQDMYTNVLRLTFAVIFFVGVGTALRLTLSKKGN